MVSNKYSTHIWVGLGILAFLLLFIILVCATSASAENSKGVTSEDAYHDFYMNQAEVRIDKRFENYTEWLVGKRMQEEWLKKIEISKRI